MRIGSKTLKFKIFQTSNQSRKLNDRLLKQNHLETSQITMYGVYGIDLWNTEITRSRINSGSQSLRNIWFRSLDHLNSPSMMIQQDFTTLKMINLMFTRLQKLQIPYILMELMCMIQPLIHKWRDIIIKGTKYILTLMSFGVVINLHDSRSGALPMLRNLSSENGSIFKSETLMANLIFIKQLLRNMEL